MPQCQKKGQADSNFFVITARQIPSKFLMDTDRCSLSWLWVRG
jgi:hypothetical protein